MGRLLPSCKNVSTGQPRLLCLQNCEQIVKRQTHVTFLRNGLLHGTQYGLTEQPFRLLFKFESLKYTCFPCEKIALALLVHLGTINALNGVLLQPLGFQNFFRNDWFAARSVILYPVGRRQATKTSKDLWSPGPAVSDVVQGNAPGPFTCSCLFCKFCHIFLSSFHDRFLLVCIPFSDIYEGPPGRTVRSHPEASSLWMSAVHGASVFPQTSSTNKSANVVCHHILKCWLIFFLLACVDDLHAWLTCSPIHVHTNDFAETTSPNNIFAAQYWRSYFTLVSYPHGRSTHNR